MTFKRSFLTIALVVLLVLICAFLSGIESEYLWYLGLSLVAAGVLFLAFNDMIYKYDQDKVREPGDLRKLNVKYCIGFVFIVVAVGMWIWALAFTDNLGFFGRIAAAVFLGGVGGLWFHTPYRKSLLHTEEKIFEIWEKFKRKILKAKTADEATRILQKNLRYRVVGDNIANSLDLDLPLGVINDKPYSFDELEKVDTEEAERLQIAMSDYIDMLVKKMEFKTPKNEEIGG